MQIMESTYAIFDTHQFDGFLVVWCSSQLCIVAMKLLMGILIWGIINCWWNFWVEPVYVWIGSIPCFVMLSLFTCDVPIVWVCMLELLGCSFGVWPRVCRFGSYVAKIDDVLKNGLTELLWGWRFCFGVFSLYCFSCWFSEIEYLFWFVLIKLKFGVVWWCFLPCGGLDE